MDRAGWGLGDDQRREGEAEERKQVTSTHRLGMSLYLESRD
jgi:hypothetical protein